MIKTRNKKMYVDSLLIDFCNENNQLSKLLHDALFPGRRSRSVLFLSLLENGKNRNVSDKIAIAIELVHRASIILDDLIDKDLMRRRRETFHVKHGSDNTILVSNILIASAYNLIISSEIVYKNDLIKLFTHTHRAMIIGEMTDIGTIKTYGMNGYTSNLLKKTSALYELAFAASAMVNNYEYEEVAVYSKIGCLFGQIYQSHNDIYDDLFADDLERGKKEVWRFNLSLTKAMAYELGDSMSRKKLSLNYDKEYLSPDEYFEFKRHYLDKSILDECRNFVQNIINETKGRLISIKSEKNKSIILSSLNNINANEYHNHYEFTKAGY